MPTGTGIIFTMVKRHLKLNCHFLKKYLPVYNNRNTGDVLSALSYEIVRMKLVSIGLFCPLKMNNLTDRIYNVSVREAVENGIFFLQCLSKIPSVI